MFYFRRRDGKTVAFKSRFLVLIFLMTSLLSGAIVNYANHHVIESQVEQINQLQLENQALITNNLELQKEYVFLENRVDEVITIIREEGLLDVH